MIEWYSFSFEKEFWNIFWKSGQPTFDKTQFKTDPNLKRLKSTWLSKNKISVNPTLPKT